MIYSYAVNEKKIIIKSDLAGEFPIYVYLDDKKQILLYCKNIKELLDDSRVIKPLEITSEGISFLLQSGVVPVPKTVYKNIFIVGVGDNATIQTLNDKIDIQFSHEFPFFNKYRDEEADVDQKYILEIMAEATISRIEENKPTYLFHSAGKNSNTIALSLAEAGYQDKITCISHKSIGETNESEISKKIADKLGFKHQVIYSPKKLEQKHIDSINYYFENIPLPCMDNVTLAYPLYATQVEFNNSNIIDGMGNDVYIGHISGKREYDRQSKFSKYNILRPLSKELSTGTLFDILTATRSEWTGMVGLTYGDNKKIFNNSYNVYNYWKYQDIKRKNLDYFDFRASIRGIILDQEMYTRKIRNFSSITSSNLILPWTNQKVAKYFSKLPEKQLFDRKKFKNKLVLRELLKDKLDLDSDKLGKLAYDFDFYSILMEMKKEVDHEILSCRLWNKNGIEKILASLYHKIDSNHKYRLRLTYLVQRLYLISAWYNHNKYVKR